MNEPEIARVRDPGLDPTAAMPGAIAICTVRTATVADVPDISSILSALGMDRDDASQNGFLRARYSYEDYERFAANGNFILATLPGRTVGFCLAFPWDSPEIDLVRRLVREVRWTEVDYSSPAHPIYENAIYIAEVGRDPALMGQEIGKRLYTELFTRFPRSNLIAAAVEEPRLNEAAKKFHLELGFKRVGTFATAEFYGLSPYQSGIYLRMSDQAERGFDESGLLGRCRHA